MSLFPRRAVMTGASILLFLGPALAEETTLAAGAGYRRPIAEVAAAYEKQSGDKVLQIYGHMGQVLAQARESGQIAIVCGDRKVLERAQGATFERMVGLGFGKLVVAYRKGLTLPKAGDLTGAEFKRIGIPDQANAIYGKAGRQFLERSALAGAIDPRLIAVATVPQVTGYVASGEVDAGFVNATDAIGAADKIGGFVAVDAKLYDPIEIACAVRAPTTRTAEGFVHFLESAQARDILSRHGL
ncbi:molybdate ABC transporter substrate-binding protein [Rhodopseudomonas sp. NSM]|uniref:molybdate ABC transporter substrate-binding protein n=1 Tax=Rhodopseudomonas sp. NSM TaxID=3457630 RepID=UPI004034F951